ncbi:MAG: 16S rRNA (cytosine(1402)-N(4))-methyltransferase [Planctomycetes bacterium]|nr:16S rRNA (cytosine(1402)-N(4))-methyltransferase [Planctomycetota bacterium]
MHWLRVQPDDVVVDATIGLGGHSAALGSRLGSGGTLIGLDRDPEALRKAGTVLAGLACRVVIRQANFGECAALLAETGIGRANVIFADLGVNSEQLDDPARGFSFQADGPLDMRLDPDAPTQASDLVNRLSEKELGDLIYENAQEPASRKIARRIHEARRSGRIMTTGHLARLVCEAVGVDPSSRRSRIHPATRTFQALRIAVNDEMSALDRFLEAAPDLLHAGGRIGVISFHGGEDRRVKRDFLRRRGEGVYRIVTKKPVVADEPERDANPRSRSAKFRVAVREPAGEAWIAAGGAPEPDEGSDETGDES